MKTEQLEALLPNHIQELLKSCPRAGDGVHNWVIRVAVRLHRFFTDQNDIANLLYKYSGDCGREVGETEIWDAITSSEQWLAKEKGKPIGRRTIPRWPERNGEQIAAITKTGPNLAQLETSSAVRWSDGQPHTEEIIDVLFPGNPLLCAAQKKESALTRRREEWRGFMANQQLMVPNPMTSVLGKAKHGGEGMRTSANTGPRRFLVAEFDQGTFDEHAALVVHLAKAVPLVLVVHSGNKSLHGWFYCAELDETQQREFMNSAVSLGADCVTWTRCQFVRMPDGQRDNGARQKVVYFNPQPVEGK